MTKLSHRERVRAALNHQQPARAILGLFGGNLLECGQFLASGARARLKSLRLAPAPAKPMGTPAPAGSA